MSKFFESLGSKASRVARQASLGLAASDLRRKIDGELLVVGRKAYELFQAGGISDAELGDACQRVAGLEEELKKVEAEIQALRLAPPPAACRKCGKEAQAGQAFCVNCGAPLSRCPNCGNVPDDEDQFCPSCGNKREPPPS